MSEPASLGTDLKAWKKWAFGVQHHVQELKDALDEMEILANGILNKDFDDLERDSGFGWTHAMGYQDWTRLRDLLDQFDPKDYDRLVAQLRAAEVPS